MPLEFSQVVHGREFDQSGTDPLKLELDHFVLDCKDMDHSVVLLGEIGDYHEQIGQVQAEIHQILAPAMEADQTEGIALEGFGDTLKQYWDKLVEFLKKVWAKIVQFFELHFTILGRRRLYVNRMIKKVKSLSTNPNTYQELTKHGAYQVSPEHARYFVIGGHFCSNFGELNQGFVKTRQVVDFITGEYSKTIADRAKLLEAAIEHATVENANETWTALFKDIEKHHSFGNLKVDMLGNVFVSYGQAVQREKGEETGAGLKDLKVTIRDLEAAWKGKPDFTPMKIDELAKVYGAMDSMLATIDTFKNGEYREIIKHSSTMISSTEKFVNLVSSYFKSGKAGEGGNNLTAYREIMGLNRFYLEWIKGPLTDLVKYITTIFHSVSLELEKNIQMYAPKPASNIFTVMGIA